jgi:hypothetical protein
LYTVSNKQESTETVAIVAVEEMWIAMVTYALLAILDVYKTRNLFVLGIKSTKEVRKVNQEETTVWYFLKYWLSKRNGK